MHKRIIQTLLAVAIATVAYCGLFWVMRDLTFVTDYDKNFAPHTVRLYCFSDNRTVNSILFYFFYPIHMFVGQPYYSGELSQTMFEEHHGRSYYVFDRSVIE